MPISPFLDGASFDAAHVEIMSRAYDKARQALHDKGQPDLVQEIIAKKVVEIAKTGERDPDQLALYTLRSG